MMIDSWGADIGTGPSRRAREWYPAIGGESLALPVVRAGAEDPPSPQLVGMAGIIRPLAEPAPHVFETASSVA